MSAPLIGYTELALAAILVLASAILSWVLLTVFAVACSQQPTVRRKLSREMVAYRRVADS